MNVSINSVGKQEYETYNKADISRTTLVKAADAILTQTIDGLFRASDHPHHTQSTVTNLLGNLRIKDTEYGSAKSSIE